MSTTTVRKTVTSKSTAMNDRAKPAFGSSAPRTTEPSAQSRQPTATTSTSRTPRAAVRPPQEPTSSTSTSEPVGTTTTTTEEHHPRTASPDSLFGTGDRSDSTPTVTAEEILSETNAAASRKGKAPMPNRPLVITGNSNAPGDPEDSPDSSSDDDVASLQSIKTVTSNFARNQSLVRAYHQTLRRCYVLQTLREADLLSYSTTPIDNQHVYVDENGMIYHQRNPQITQPERPIEDHEVAPLRMIYPEPFSEQDSIRRTFRTGSSPRNERSDSRSDTEPPYAKKIRAACDRHISSTRHGRGGVRRNPVPRSTEPRETPIHRGESEPPSSETDQSHHCTGGNGGPPDGGDGPPSDDPNNGEPSDAEPHNSEDEHNRIIKRERLSSNPSVRGQRPGVFGRTRYSSADPTFNEEEIFLYDPTPKSQEEVLRAAFRMFEKLIERQLYIPGSSAPNNAQKTVIQNIPKPGYYYGDQDFLVFDEFIRDIVRWLNVANLCGSDVRWSNSKGCYVLTSVDMFRKNTLVSFLCGDARHWYVDAIESGLDDPDSDDPLHGQTTFMQVVSGLYRRFIHESSLTLVTERYDDVVYTAGKGIKGVFAELTRYAKSMPSPPDVYSFKKRLMLLVPEEMASDMRKIHRITPENSSVNDIMQAALLCERSHKAALYYNKARDQMKRTKRRRSRSRSKDRKRKDNRKNNRQSSRSPSPRRLQVVDNRRYSVRANSPPRDKRQDSQNQGRFSQRDGRAQDRQNFNRKFQPFYKKKWDGQGDKANQQKGNNRLFRMVDSNGKGTTRLFRIAEASENESEHEPPETTPQEATPSDHSSESDSGNDTEGTGLIGSQYSSDDADEEYMERVGFMMDTSESEAEYSSEYRNESSTDDESTEVLNLDFGEYLRSITVDTDGNAQSTLRPTLVAADSVGTRPQRTLTDNKCLTAFIDINGVRAFTLFDSGSTADAVSPDFARIAKLAVYHLENPVTFQLGTKGSRSRISHGCDTKYSFASSHETVSEVGYFDVANIDRYDAVVGTVFMRRHGLSLNFSDNSIRLNGKSIPTLDEGEETTELARRHAKIILRERYIEKSNKSRARTQQPHTGLSEKALGKRKATSPSP
ncbi:hypothetical protein PM082_023103 [Marasmius tenuissimus]|nr:hypothetical protein PM082_023103 [Marasmius tenuissimus]